MKKLGKSHKIVYYHDYLIKQYELLDNIYDENEINTINKIKRVKF